MIVLFYFYTKQDFGITKLFCEGKNRELRVTGTRSLFKFEKFGITSNCNSLYILVSPCHLGLFIVVVSDGCFVGYVCSTVRVCLKDLVIFIFAIWSSNQCFQWSPFNSFKRWFMRIKMNECVIWYTRWVRSLV